MRRRELFGLLIAATFAATGCGSKHVVRAAPPSVSTPPREETPPMPQPVTPPPSDTKTEEPPPEVTAPMPPLAPAKRPAPRPRPAQPESTPSKPAPLQISPQLSAKDLEAAKGNTTSNMMSADKNLQATAGKQLSAAQKDLVEKINGFLGQAREAIVADDWVRAQNLAEKARVLSNELVKSL